MGKPVLSDLIFGTANEKDSLEGNVASALKSLKAYTF